MLAAVGSIIAGARRHFKHLRADLAFQFPYSFCRIVSRGSALWQIKACNALSSLQAFISSIMRVWSLAADIPGLSLYPHPSSSGKQFVYFTLVRGVAIISATVSRHVT